MGLSMTSALMIKGNDDIRIGHFQSKGKLGFVIQLWKDKEYHTDIVSSDAVFKSKEESETYAKNLIKSVKESPKIP